MSMKNHINPMYMQKERNEALFRFETYLVWLQRQCGIIIAVYFDNLMIKIAEHIVQEISNQSNTCKEGKHLRFEAYLVWDQA